MFTSDILLNMAIEAMDAYHSISGDTPEVRSQRYDLYRTQEMALQCAEWMEKHSIDERSQIGPFGELPFKKGQRIRIKKGAIVHGTGSAIPAGGKEVNRTYGATVFDVYPGYVSNHRGEIELRNQQVHWVGENGYWRWTDATNVIGS